MKATITTILSILFYLTSFSQSNYSTSFQIGSRPGCAGRGKCTFGQQENSENQALLRVIGDELEIEIISTSSAEFREDLNSGLISVGEELFSEEVKTEFGNITYATNVREYRVTKNENSWTYKIPIKWEDTSD